MSVTPINLNKARKARVRADAEAKAAQNRIKFGLSKADKLGEAKRAAKVARDLDGHKRER